MGRFNVSCLIIVLVLSATASASLIGSIMDGISSLTTNLLDAVGATFVRELINTLYATNPLNNHYADEDPENHTSYDFIIVGAGTAGCVLANRLTEISNWSVLILEVGTQAPVISDIPLVLTALQYTKLDWDYYAEYNNSYCRACTRGVMHFPRGKVLGGSSVLNDIMHTRGNKEDYDKWERMGNKGWGWNDVLPYFKKLEDARGVAIQDPGYHGTKGYLSVSDIPYRTGVAHAFINASEEAGFKYVDSNGASELGVTWIQSALKNGERHSEERAYLRPVRKRKNLKIITKAKVSKVLLNDEGTAATGAVFKKKGYTYIAHAKKEVILTAGSFNTPQLLMLSGIGPKDELEKNNIDVKKDLPVGQSMYDHLVFLGLVYKIKNFKSLTLLDFLKIKTYTDYLFQRKGPWTMSAALEAMVYINTNTTGIPPEYPDVEIVMAGAHIGVDLGIIYRHAYSFSADAYDHYWKKFELAPGFQLNPLVLHPKSFGCIRLKSDKIEDPPVFYPQYFSDERDIATFVAAIRVAQKIVQQPSLQKFGAKMVDIPLPGCEEQVFDSDKYWECAVRGYAITTHHHISTCRMGQKSDPTSVVNDRLIVHGVKNLRVSDASVMPSTMSGHTNAPTIMIAEKASDIIKEDWGQKQKSFN